MSDGSPNKLPAAVDAALGGVPKSLVPATVKALDRLIGGAIDIPAAWLAQKKAKIDAQTEAYKAVETAIAKAAATEAGADPAIVGRAVEVLVRKSYREQRNREAVAAATVEELEAAKPAGAPQEEGEEPTTPPPPPDEEWLNVFEQYAERASTERMQRLWGRVLAGEIRRPGHFSMRTLRFLSEFSQKDARDFAKLAQSAFGDCAPMELVKPAEVRDIRPLVDLESAGLVHGVSGLGLERTATLDENGHTIIREGNLGILLKGEPGAKITDKIAALTPLGRELLSLVERNPLAAARRVAQTFKGSALTEVQLVVSLGNKQWRTFEMVWAKPTEDA